MLPKLPVALLIFYFEKNLVKDETLSYPLSYVYDKKYIQSISDMAIKKPESFEAKDIRLAELARALSHPARTSILRTLAEKNKCICGEIVDTLPLAQSTVSQHLKELKKAQLIDGEIEGPKSCYCINWKALKEFSEGIYHLFNELKCC